ncbi:monovalent cation:proton antiporter-2 (CPA2) family protein [Hyphococcus flavus]|uniref:Monovalent cation:proton antiporter-2 (CPA2) family protein n=1 Tax=Hyphococcus flavus TaxID=1866326 RepID=A0AAE9ZC48_9PROT|nr:monovalent cation:proton antiporter-2 (CPA2) family protein [Hyphococcus flavus]WDI32123.1 monovalent cation:proton antiporter-2 (CPA2) family protein [Hyphococcus flavus]
MAAGESDFLVQAATYLGAAAITVPVFNRLKLGSILGFLTAGVAVGPFGFNLLHQEEGVFHIAELGVVLFLFVIGLELSLSRLWSMRKQIFGLGAAQMFVTGGVIASLFVAAGVMPAPAAAIAGFSLAFSSTAFALQWLKDRGELNTAYGTQSFSVLLFQDIAVIPLLAAVPIIAGVGADGNAWEGIAKAVGVVALLIVIGKFGLDRLFRLVASAGSREAFAATALFLVALTSLAVAWAGLSMALGAFLAGVLLAESSYKHEIETDIEPFRGLLLGLFFISIGMRLDFGVILNAWMIVVGGAVGLVAIKTVLLFGLSRLMGAKQGDALKSAATLSQGGEFSFVVFTLGVSAALFTNAQVSLMSAIVTLSMILTPLMSAIAHRMAADADDMGEDLKGPEAERDHALIVGFGRMGQIISQVLQNSGVAVTAIDRNPSHIRNAESFGFKVYYGDGARLDMLLAAGAADAKAIILCMDDPKSVNHAVTMLREKLPNTTILAVAHDRIHEMELKPLGPDVIVRETLESSLLMARETLSRLGFESGVIDDYVQQFRKLDRERLLTQIDQGPEAGRHLMHQRFTSESEKKSEEKTNAG